MPSVVHFAVVTGAPASVAVPSLLSVSTVMPSAPAPWPSVSVSVTGAAAAPVEPATGTVGATAIDGSEMTAACVLLKTAVLVVACVVTKLV